MRCWPVPPAPATRIEGLDTSAFPGPGGTRSHKRACSAGSGSAALRGRLRVGRLRSQDAPLMSCPKNPRLRRVVGRPQARFACFPWNTVTYGHFSDGRYPKPLPFFHALRWHPGGSVSIRADTASMTLPMVGSPRRVSRSASRTLRHDAPRRCLKAATGATVR